MNPSQMVLRAIRKTVQREGGYVNHPDDRGGETNFGISKKSFPDVDIKNLTLDQAIEIYFREYWIPIHVDLIDSIRVKWKVFDIGVNMGRIRAVELLQKGIGVTVDGSLGPKTATAANKKPEIDVLLGIAEAQAIRYAQIVKANTSQAIFLEGWIARAFDLGRDI